MFKKLAALSLLAATGSAFAVDGTVNVTGTVATVTCTVTVSPASVALPIVQRGALATAGAVAGITQFKINTTGCTVTGYTNMSTYFEYGTTINASGRLNNTTAVGSGGASNVDVQILNTNLGVVNLAGAAGSQNVPSTAISSGSQTFYAQYYATGAATAGTVTSNFTFTLTYS